ncbi:hypothetical protein THF1D04_10774 [Vibrio owensii]|uniref:Uncharacterized protein n=1 Tax=Vibrio owensii TaxID=696485 RepID=A0AAU9PZR6_9VIBR|nr:hypothetical protein THF1D04_10774 [Vibrio owensii]
MADKFFIATCEKKVSKHPVKDGASFILPIKAATQQEAKNAIREQVEQLDPSFEGSGKGYSDWFKGPLLEKVTEEQYNVEVLAIETAETSTDELNEEQLNAPTNYPQLADDGFYNSKDDDVIESSFIYSSTDELMQAAKVFILNVGPHQWAFGFRYKNGDFDQHEKMNQDRLVDTKEDAIDSAINRLEGFLDMRDEFGVEDQERPFLAAVLEHDFYRAFLEPSELLVEAISKHPDIKNALAEHADFYEVVESHFASVWPLDEPATLVIEHLMSMAEICIIYDLEAFTAIMKGYRPMELSEATKQSMDRIEDVIDKPAANDASLQQQCWKAALPVTDDFHVVLAIKDCGDEGWLTAFEGNLKQDRVFGDADDFGDEFSATRKEAIKFAAGQATNALYNYDTTLSLAKVFMKSPYIQNFEDNCMQLGVEESESQTEIEYPTILEAIVERLNKRVTTPNQPEIDNCYEIVSQFITEDTNLEVLANSIIELKVCKSMFVEDDAQALVERCENIELGKVDYPVVLDAIRERLENEKHTVTPERAYTQMSKIITETTDTAGLGEAIKALKNPVIIWHSTESVNLVMKFTSDKKAQPEQKQEDKKEVVNNEPESTGESKEVTTEDSTSKSDDDGSTSGSDDIGDDSVVPSDVVSKEAANDPISIPSIELDENNPNMRIWNAAFKTDLDYTKQNGDRLSINSQYRQMKATAIFGARGKGWGVIVNREWIEEGMPIFVNGAHIGVNESIHNIEIDLWYIDPETGERHTISSVYGETERWYWSYNYARLIKNTDIRKKSLTDATGKALSMLGICGDVYMGEYDDERIFNRSQATKATTNEIKTMEFDAKTAQLVLDKAKSYTDKFKTAPSLAEIKRLQKLAETSLAAFPTTDKESTDKKAKALSRIAEQADEAIEQFNLDKAQANDK